MSFDDEAPATTSESKPIAKKKHASIDDDADASAATPAATAAAVDDDREASKPIAHHASIDDDTDSESSSSSSSSASDDVEHKKLTIDEVEAEAQAHPLDGLRHSFAISAGLDGGTWSYDFSGGNAATQLKAGAGIIPGGSVHVDAAPLAFAGVHFFGVDADFGAAEHTFQLAHGASAVTPGAFTSLQLRYAVAAKARYTFDNGMGVGVRVGYRYEGAGSASQTVALNHQNVAVTQVPGYGLDALAVGADVFLPFIVGDHRLELDVRAEGLPLALYKEVPDSPGATVAAFGWHGEVAARYDLFSGFFAEVRGETTGVHASYSDKGTRNVIDPALGVGKVASLNGGRVYNLTGSGTMALGFMF